MAHYVGDIVPSQIGCPKAVLAAQNVIFDKFTYESPFDDIGHYLDGIYVHHLTIPKGSLKKTVKFGHMSKL